MEKLTKELLLQYPSHSSIIVREAAYGRLAEEVMKTEGLVDFKELKFEGEDALDAGEFYRSLDAFVKANCHKDGVIRRYCQIVKQDSLNTEMIIQKMLDLAEYLKGSSTYLNQAICNCLNLAKPGYYDSSYIMSLLSMPQISDFLSVAKNRLQQLTVCYPELVEPVGELAETHLTDALDMIDILICQNDASQNRSLCRVLCKIIAGREEETSKQYLKGQTRIFKLLTKAVRMLDFHKDREIEELNRTMFDLHRKKLLNKETMSLIVGIELEQVISGREAFLDGALQRLILLSSEDIMTAVYFFYPLSQLIKRIKESKIEVLFVVIRFIHKLREQNFDENYFSGYEGLYRRFGSVCLPEMKAHQLSVSVNIWLKLNDKDNLLFLFRYAPIAHIMLALEAVAEKKEEWLPEVFDELNLQNIEDKSIFAVSLTRLADTHPSLQYVLRQVLAQYEFEEKECRCLQQIFRQYSWTAELRIKTVSKDSERDIADILKLLEA